VKRASLLALALLASGCHSYLLPFDDRPLPARGSLETESGQRLAVAYDGELLARPPRGDVGAALGVGLFADEAGLVVSNQLHPDTPLIPGDKILWVAPVFPARAGRKIARLHEAALLGDSLADVEEGFDQFSLPRSRGAEPGRRTPEALRQAAGAHGVKHHDDLRGYLCGLGWLNLDLLVARGDEQIVVRVALERREAWVPTRPLKSDRSRWRGLALVGVEELPPALRPTGSVSGEVLVTRVARGSPLGRAGLRPLDVLTTRAADLLLSRHKDLLTQLFPKASSSFGQTLEEDGAILVAARTPDGTLKQLEFVPRQAPTDLWFPFLFSQQNDGTRSHLGVGPLDMLFHTSDELVYLPTQDRYLRSSRWSVLTIFQGGARRTNQGTEDWGGINFLVDDSRIRYFKDWMDTPRMVRKERGLEGY
jgi:hypothetical protein